jgi:hypothetical protein
MVVILSFIIFLFAVYMLSKDDFILLRRNVSVEQIFDSAFLMAAFALLLSRFMFVGLHFKTDYFNPLVFFLVPYFPGLSLAGALLGSLVFVWFYTRFFKMPTGRIADIFSVGFFYAFSFGFLLLSILDIVQKAYILAAVTLVASLLSFVVSFLGSSTFFSVKWRDGALSLLMIFFSSIFYITWHVISLLLQKQPLFDKEFVVFGVLLLLVGVISIRYASVPRKRL